MLFNSFVTLLVYLVMNVQSRPIVTQPDVPYIKNYNGTISISWHRMIDDYISKLFYDRKLNVTEDLINKPEVDIIHIEPDRPYLDNFENLSQPEMTIMNDLNDVIHSNNEVLDRESHKEIIPIFDGKFNEMKQFDQFDEDTRENLEAIEPAKNNDQQMDREQRICCNSNYWQPFA
ncbi:hypothetical protein SNEBB_003152 [Seison nebaliae]|nr:hypothetical protein SNEBB_003152 [Seison nebaliae]